MRSNQEEVFVDIIDYRHARVNQLLFVFAIVMTSTIGIIQLAENLSSEFTRFMVYSVYSLVLMIISAFLGVGAKRAIGFRPGKWERVKKKISLNEYKAILKKQKIDFGKFYSEASLTGGCCITMMVPYLLVLVFATVPEEFVDESFWLTPLPLILLVFVYVIFGYLCYLIGYYSVKFGIKLGFKEPVEEVYKFAKKLSNIPDLETQVKVEVGIRESYTILYDSEFVFYIVDLSEDVYIQLKVADSSPGYGYLVGLIIDGPTVKERTEEVDLGTKCPIVIEYSNDSNATVLVCRYDIEAKGCYWKQISQKNIQKLGVALIPKLRELHSNQSQ
ncbi:MAG: hypothetical protein RTU30_14660 [Candidatus Thorarchaeota archaeon]